MQGAVRPYVTAGVALVGASVIAVSPVAPPVPDIKVAATPNMSTAMQLASTSNPLLALSQLVGNSLNSASGLFGQFAASPAPILSQVLVNQSANFDLVALTAQQIATLLPDLVEQVGTDLQKIASQLGAGDIVGAAETLNQTLLIAGLPLLGLIGPPLTILQNTTQNVANVFAKLPENVFPVLMAALGPVFSTINGAADIAQTVLDAARAGDFVTAVGALVSAPIVMADVILNGFDGGVGLLTPQLNPFTAGPIGILLGMRNVIADALEPIVVPAGVAAANQAPDIQADVITLSLDATAKTAGVLDAASSGVSDDATGAAGGTDGSGVAAVSDVEDVEDVDDALDEGEAEEQETEEGAAGDGTLDDDEAGIEDADQAGAGSGSGEVRESLVATPGQTGLSVGSEAGDGNEASEQGQAAGAADANADDSDTDGDAGGDAGASNDAGGSESGGPGGDE